MSGWLIFFLVIIVLVVAGSLTGAKVTADHKKALSEEFPNAIVHLSSDDASYLVIDFSTSYITVGVGQMIPPNTHPGFYRDEYDFSEIAGFEVKKDGNIVNSTDRGSQALGAAAGALAFGGVGLIVGGLSGKSKSEETVRSISLSLKVRDQSRPVHTINFFRSPDKKGVKMSHLVVKQAIDSIDVLAAHLANAIHQSQELKVPKGPPPLPEKKLSMAAEFRELADMKNAGILTEDEFTAAKARLIAR